MDNFQIRRLKVEDAEVIGQIYAAITRRPVEPDFKSVVEEHARSGEEACFVAEHQGKVVGFMISYILTAGFGEAKSAWIGSGPKFHGPGNRCQFGSKDI